MDHMSTYRTAGIKDLDSVKLGLLSDSIGLGSDSTGAVGAVAVTVSVLTIASVVGEESSTTLKLGVRSGNASVNDIGASTGASRVVVGVGCATLALVRDTSKAPGRRRLGYVGLLLEVRLAKVGSNNSVLLNVVDLYCVSILEDHIRGRKAYTREVAKQLNNVISHISRETTESSELVDMSRVLLENLQGSVDEVLKVLVLHLDDPSSGDRSAGTGNDDRGGKGKSHRQKCEKK